MVTSKLPQSDVYDVTHALSLIRRNAGLPPAELALLCHLVERTAAGGGEDLSQKTIAEDLLHRNLSEFDAHTDSTVRTTKAKLRKSLMKYYAGRGQADSVIIELPSGSYAPRSSRRLPLSAGATSRLWNARAAIESRTVTGYAVALKHLDAVIAEAPDQPLVLALKAEALASRAIHGERPLPLLEEAQRLAVRAVNQPQPVWQAWLALGMVRQALDWDWAGAEECYRDAAELSPEALTHVWHTAFLVGRGRPKEAISHLERHVDHYGYSNPTCIGDLAMLLLLARDYDEASIAIEAALETQPDYYQHHMNRAILLEARGDAKGAVAVLDQTPLRLLERPVTWGLRALFAGLSGSPAVARRRISWFQAARKAGRYVPPSQLAACWLGAGEPDQAVQQLEAAAADRDPLVVWFHAYPFFRHLHSHPGFRALIDRLGLTWF